MVLAAVATFSTPGFGASHYVRSGASGNRTGADWSNAYTTLPDVLVRGDVYYIGAGTYAGYTFNDAPSGTTPIIVKAATAADHGTGTGWSTAYVGEAKFNTQSNGGILTFNQPYYTVDGQYRNGDWISGYGFHVDNSKAVTTNAAINLQASNITLRYTNVEGSHDTSTAPCGTHTCDETVTDFGNGNITVEYSYIHDAGEATFKLRGSSTSDGSGALVNFTAQYNLVARNWSQGGGNVHSEAFSVSDGVQNFVVRYNKFVDIRGTGVIATASGSCYNGCPNFNRGNGPWYIYGNQWWYSAANPVSYCDVGGFVSLFDVGFVNTIYVYNNTIANVNDSFCNDGGSGGNATVNTQDSNVHATSIIVQNNIWYNSNGGASLTLASGTSTVDHNDTAETNIFVSDAGRDYHLKSDTAAWNPLSSSVPNACTSGVNCLNIDPDQIVRSSSRGAFQFANAVSLNPPTGLTASVY